MKKVCFFLVFLFITAFAYSQAGQWVWLHGSNGPSSLGSHGTKGVPSVTNDPPSMYEPCEWKDKNGNFWMYGGLSTTFSCCYPDLWKYDPVANQWTWMNGSGVPNDVGSWGVQGVPSPSNHPPALSWGMASWVDNSGNFWMMGGQSYGTNLYCDMWKYDLSTAEWTWMKGPGTQNSLGRYGIKGVPDPANNPCQRGETAGSWTDKAGDLWLFGGAVGCNDMWRYNIASNMWTWMKGDSVSNTVGVFGTKGVEASSNNPPGDVIYSKWEDKSGNLWVFGHSYNGLMRYNPSTNNWTWINGNNIMGTGVYGTKCVAASGNLPPSRTESRASWTDGCGNFWMFGGTSYNDLWMYKVTDDTWTWVSGDNFNYAPGNWGTQGVFNASNKPNGRMGSVPWIDSNNNLYLFGGCDAGYSSYYNDVWKYVIDTSCVGPISCAVVLPVADFTASDSILCANDCISFTNLSVNSTSWQWTFDGGIPGTSTDQNPNVCYLDTGIYKVTLVAAGSGATDTLAITNYISVHPTPPTPIITPVGNTLYCSTDPTYTFYQWYDSATLIPGANDTLLAVNHSGNYNVQVANKYGCKVAVGINFILGLSSQVKDNFIFIYPNPATTKLTIEVWPFHKNESHSILVTNLLGQAVYQSVITKPLSEINISALPAGIYFAEIVGEKERWVRRFVKE